jgi:crossover junction endodeoxyribonuclease RusA
MIQVPLPFPPSVNGLWRSNGKGQTYTQGKPRAWKTAAAWAFKEAVLKGSTPCLGSFHFYLEAGRPDKRKRDLDNLFKCVLDAAKDGGAIRDDSDALSVSARWVADIKGIRVTITPAEEWA